MVDVTLRVFLNPASHDLSYNPQKAAFRNRRGDIFHVYLSDTIATLVGNDYILDGGALGRDLFAWIHIRNVPNARARQMHRVLTQDSGETRLSDELDPETGLPQIVSDAYRRHRWRIPQSVIPAAARATLLAEHEITVGWSNFRNAIRRKVIISRTDPSQDDESNSVTNSELS